MRHAVIVKKVYYGNDLDDETLEERERGRRGMKLADGWIDGEGTLREGIPIARGVSSSFYVGDRSGRPEMMDRAWAEGDERHGLKIVENDLGEPLVATFSWSGNVTTGNEDELEWEPPSDGRYLIIAMNARAKGATNCQARVVRKDIDGNNVETIHTLTFSSPRGQSPLLGQILPAKHALAPKIVATGGARNLVMNVFLRELP